jgi:hypothetical protein
VNLNMESRQKEFENWIRMSYSETSHSLYGGSIDDQFLSNETTPKGYHEPIYQTIYHLLKYASTNPRMKFPFSVKLLRSDNGVQEFDIYYNIEYLQILVYKFKPGYYEQDIIRKKSVTEFCSWLVTKEFTILLDIQAAAKKELE